MVEVQQVWDSGVNAAAISGAVIVVMTCCSSAMCFTAAKLDDKNVILFMTAGAMNAIAAIDMATKLLLLHGIIR